MAMNSKVSRRVLARTIAEKLAAEPVKQRHVMKMLAAYIIDQHLENEVDLLLKDIIRELFTISGQLLVSATTARPLTDALRKELTASLRAATGAKSIVLEEHVDPALVGGFVAKTPDGELDASIRTQLQHLAAIK